MISMTTTNRDAVVVHAAGSGITLTDANETDLSKTLDVAKDAFPDPVGWWNNADDSKHYTSKLAGLHSRSLKCVVAKIGADVVGYIFYQPQRRGSEIYIKELATHPAHKGKGISMLLLAYAIGEAKDNGRSHMKLYTAKGDVGKQGFYTQFGCAKVARRDYRTDGYTTDDENPDKGSDLLSGVVNTVWGTLKAKMGI